MNKKMIAPPPRAAVKPPVVPPKAKAAIAKVEQDHGLGDYVVKVGDWLICDSVLSLDLTVPSLVTSIAGRRYYTKEFDENGVEVSDSFKPHKNVRYVFKDKDTAFEVYKWAKRSLNVMNTSIESLKHKEKVEQHELMKSRKAIFIPVES